MAHHLAAVVLLQLLCLHACLADKCGWPVSHDRQWSARLVAAGLWLQLALLVCMEAAYAGFPLLCTLSSTI